MVDSLKHYHLGCGERLQSYSLYKDTEKAQSNTRLTVKTVSSRQRLKKEKH